MSIFVKLLNIFFIYVHAMIPLLNVFKIHYNKNNKRIISKPYEKPQRALRLVGV